ncbi:MAG TPA: FAD-dependent oxidoreductase [Gemmatimonadaceae bacterium]
MAERRDADVVVIGAGPAGLAAAVHAAETGVRVVVVDQSSNPGGQIWRHRDARALPPAARQWLDRFGACGAALLADTAVVSADSGRLLVAGPNGAIALHARAIVLATGARELFLPFPGWTLPNVFGVGGLQALVKSGLDVRGKRVVIAGSGPLLFPVAATVAAAGADLLAVCEHAARGRLLAFAASLWRSPSKLAAAAAYRSAFRRTPFRTGAWVERAEGRDRLESVAITDGRRRWIVPCDYLATAAGLIPNVEVGLALGCEVARGALVVDARQATSVGGVFAAGECTGVAGEDAAVIEGTVAGLAAAGRDPGAWSRRAAAGRAFARRLAAAFAPRREVTARADATTIVCRCEDVRCGDLQPDWGSRQAKLAARAGMGACQGRVCGAALQQMFGWDAPRVRPPLIPVPTGVLGDPEREPR